MAQRTVTGTVYKPDGTPGTDTLNASAEALNFDIHYEIDGFGSNSEYTK